jgi:probable rRNA maturation factor
VTERPNVSMLDISVRVSDSAPSLDVSWLVRLLQHAGKRERLAGEIGVWLCTDAEISGLHESFMGIPDPTDVITFPSGDEASPDAAYLGDIAVSFETAAQQAGDAGHSTAREIAFLVVHGLLHLAGYDDQTSAEREAMIGRQEALISEFEQHG